MQTTDQAILVLTNVPDEATAQSIARAVVEGCYAACVNILPPVRSVYRWQGALKEANELSLLIKTTHARYAALEAAIKTIHPYDVPEIIALPIVAGLPAYLDWVAQETRKDIDV